MCDLAGEPPLYLRTSPVSMTIPDDRTTPGGRVVRDKFSFSRTTGLLLHATLVPTLGPCWALGPTLRLPTSLYAKRWEQVVSPSPFTVEGRPAPLTAS